MRVARLLGWLQHPGRAPAVTAGEVRARRVDVDDGDTREQALRRMEEIWLALWPRLNGLDDDALTRPGAAGDWSARDVLAHLARWHEATLEVIAAHARRQGTIETYEDYERWNARWYKQDRSLAPAEARARAATSYLDLRAAVAALPADGWDAFVRAWVRGSTWEHYGEHIEALDAAAADGRRR